MLLYTIFEKGLEQDPNTIRCPNCKAINFKSDGASNVYCCKTCTCRFLVEYEIEKLNKLDDKPVKIYEIKNNELVKTKL